MSDFPTYEEARAAAHTSARRYKQAYGIEKPTAYQQWTIKMLPRRENRFGFEARIEAVEADDPCIDNPCRYCGTKYEGTMTLHERIAEHLGWPLKDAQSFSYQSLREIVTDVKLKQELTAAIQSGSYIVGEPRKKKRRPL